MEIAQYNKIAVFFKPQKSDILFLLNIYTQ